MKANEIIRKRRLARLGAVAALVGIGTALLALLFAGLVLLIAVPLEGHPHFVWAVVWTKGGAFLLIYLATCLVKPCIRARGRVEHLFDI